MRVTRRGVGVLTQNGDMHVVGLHPFQRCENLIFRRQHRDCFPGQHPLDRGPVTLEVGDEHLHEQVGQPVAAEQAGASRVELCSCD